MLGFFSATVPRITRAHAGGKPALDGGEIANAAAELAGNFHRREDRFHRRAVDRLAGKGAVEIDQMQPGRARGSEFARLIRGIAVVDGGVVHGATAQPHAGAILEIDRRIEDQDAVRSFQK